MQIVIPMSGFGERFRAVGYTVPKPLIQIDGKPIIQHVVEMFPGEADFTFICNQEHLDTPDYRMREILQSLVPNGRIVGIAPHKLGPVNAVLQVAELLEPSEPVIVNYCDFTCLWDWEDFKNFIIETGCDGAVPAYKGFHPHSLGSTNYAYIQENGGWIINIQEKQPFTKNRMNEFASSGTYYFSSAELMTEAFRTMMKEGLSVGGEFYVSLAYKPLVQSGLDIAVYQLQHFMQWGTPSDVREYIGWSEAFARLSEGRWNRPKQNGPIVIPMAGLGNRFVREGYTTTKPLIPVSGEYMAIQAMRCLPESPSHVFVVREDMTDVNTFAEVVANALENTTVARVPSVTGGQAISAEIGLQALEPNEQLQTVTFGACDFGMIYNATQFENLMSADDWDVIIWTTVGHANAIRNPQMYGWVRTDSEGNVTAISVKKPFDNPETDQIVTGTFTFKSGTAFEDGLAILMKSSRTVNGEYYLDSVAEVLFELGFKVKSFLIDHFFAWGTPNDLKTFEYWQSCFHQWKSHPYSLEADFMVSRDKVADIESSFTSLSAPRPSLRSNNDAF